MFSLIRFSRRFGVGKFLPIKPMFARISTSPTFKKHDDDEEDTRPTVFDIDMDDMMEADPELARTFNYKRSSGIELPASYYNHAASLILEDLDAMEKSEMQHLRSGTAIEKMKNDAPTEKEPMEKIAPKPVKDEQADDKDESKKN